jgi:hypothetical protein
MKIEMMSIEKVKPYEQNPRINDAAVDAVAASIKEFGFRQPIVVDKDGVIICGHTRWKAALKLGLKKVPVHVATDLTPAQVKAYRLADNRSAELAEWDFSKLAVELDGVDDALKASLADLDFDALTLASVNQEIIGDTSTERSGQGVSSTWNQVKASSGVYLRIGDLECTISQDVYMRVKDHCSKAYTSVRTPVGDTIKTILERGLA